MQFKNPEVLYALLALLIPIIVHLFRLRKFQREEFTNVKFLKKISRETRKSSQLKKFLILLCRLLLLSCLVIAFAQPYLPSSAKKDQGRRIFYLDNSYSMQAKKGTMALLPEAVQKLLENIPKKESFSLYTNNEEFEDVTLQEIRDELQDVSYTAQQLTFKNLQLIAKNRRSKKPDEKLELVMLSDFSKNFELPQKLKDSNFVYSAIPLRAGKSQNISIDSAFLQNKQPGEIQISVNLSRNYKDETPVSVSVFNANRILAKTTTNFENDQAKLSFTLNEDSINTGHIEINDKGLTYDNSLYFSIQKAEKMEVVSISAKEDRFLKRIFPSTEFNLKQFSTSRIDYNQLTKANLIILNEINEIPSALTANLKKAKQNGSTLAIIPSKNTDIGPFNTMLASLNGPTLKNKKEGELRISTISFDHPLFQGVFEKRTENFDYPKVNFYFPLLNKSAAVLNYQNGAPFLTGSKGMYVFSSALNLENSNFQNSPLIVPTFYNMALQARSPSQIYYEINENNKITIPVHLEKDKVLHISGKDLNFIPPQQQFINKVLLTTTHIPDKSGNFKVLNNKKTLAVLSFNLNRKESKTVLQDLSKITNLKVYPSIANYFESLKAAHKTTTLWKWFLIFALFFLILETLLLNYFK